MLSLPSRPQPVSTFATALAGPRRSRLLTVGFLVLAGLVLSAAAMSARTISVDEPILKAIQDVLPGWYEAIGNFSNYELRGVVIPALWAASVIGFIALRRNDYAAMFVLLIFQGPFTSFLKRVIDRPRPAGDFEIIHFPSDASFPSGHTITAMVFFGLWFVMAARVLPSSAVLPVRAVSITAIGVTGLSRIWAGAHWPTDVLGGIVFGALFLMAVLALQPLLRALNSSVGRS